MKLNLWKIGLGIYLLCLLALVVGVVLPRLTPSSRSLTYGMAVLLAVLGFSLARYFFRK